MLRIVGFAGDPERAARSLKWNWKLVPRGGLEPPTPLEGCGFLTCSRYSSASIPGALCIGANPNNVWIGCDSSHANSKSSTHPGAQARANAVLRIVLCFEAMKFDQATEHLRLSL